MNFSDNKAFAFLESLFPGGLKDPALIAELCPEGWENSPLFACYYPSPRVRYEENLKWSRNLKRLGLSRRNMQAEPLETAQTPVDEPEPSFEEYLVQNPPTQIVISPQAAINEPAELLGLCLWDIFSNNHEVIAADGRIVDLGSFRGSAGVISDFYESLPAPEAADRHYAGGCGYMDFYMGTCWLGKRADLTPVYQFIFRRLKALGADWSYAFPQVHLIDFGPREDDPSVPYDPSATFQKEAEEKTKAVEITEMRRKLDRDLRSAKRKARTQQPPATVQSYQTLYYKFPIGWPPDFYPDESQI
jgi:hypothetical protein